MKEYHKIYNLYLRNDKGILIDGCFSRYEFQYLSKCEWVFYEKVDGTNIRIMWNGKEVTFGGKTDNAQIPPGLITHLNNKFCTPKALALFQEKFGEIPVCLYGEGYGAGIQKVGIKYHPKDKMFILFDILINNYWFNKKDVMNIGNFFEVPQVELRVTGTFNDAIEYLRKECKSNLGDCEIEGLIGLPKIELRTKDRERIIVKIKTHEIRRMFSEKNMHNQEGF